MNTQHVSQAPPVPTSPPIRPQSASKGQAGKKNGHACICGMGCAGCCSRHHRQHAHPSPFVGQVHPSGSQFKHRSPSSPPITANVIAPLLRGRLSLALGLPAAATVAAAASRSSTVLTRMDAKQAQAEQAMCTTDRRAQKRTYHWISMLDATMEESCSQDRVSGSRGDRWHIAPGL